MKQQTKLSVFAAGVVAMSLLLLGTSSYVQAEPTVIFDTDNATKAIGIQNLSYNNELWNVDFTDFVSARSVYGDHPGKYDFPGIDLAEGAIFAVNDALNTSVATGVGSDTLEAADTYAIGYFPQGGNTVPEGVLIATGSNNTMAPMNWGVGTLEGSVLYNVAENAAPTWADFTLVSAVQTVIFDESGTNAIGIENLDIGGTLFDVTFTASVTAEQVYGPLPGELDVPGIQSAQDAVDAMTAALNDASAATVGDGASAESFFVGYLISEALNGTITSYEGNIVDETWDRKPIALTTPYTTGDKVWATFTPAAGGGPPPADNVVKVFVTGQSYDGDIGLVGADSACRAAANDVGLPGNWTAWLSDSTTDAVDRIFDAGTGYQLVDGTVIADSLADLLDGTLDAPIMVMENGDAIPGGALAVWTNTNADGTKGDGGSCDNWTTNVNTEVGRFGLADQTDETWTNSGGGQPCDVFNRLYCFADQVDPTGPVDLTGIVETAGGTPLCALALASGQFMFTCNPNGPFSLLDLPRESNDTVKRQVYVDGFFPNVETLTGSVDETVVMQRTGTCPDYNSFPQPGVFPDSAGKRIDVSGTVLLQNTATPVCAMVLANGQFGFTCDGTGNYAANIPLDNNGQYKLQVYAQGFAPMIQRFDEFSPDNDVRLARASECQ